MADVDSLTAARAGRALQEMPAPTATNINSNNDPVSTSPAATFLSSFLKPQASMKEQIASKSKSPAFDNKAQMYLMRHAGVSKREGRTMKELNVNGLKRLEKVGRAMAKDKEAFDREMLERRAVEAREVEIAENMGYIMPTKEEREKIELRKSEEVLERVALQTLNKQFGKRLIAQRHQLKALTEEHEHAVLDLQMLVNSADAEDRVWKEQNLETHAVRWDRHILLKTSQISKAQIKLDNLRARIDKHRSVCTLHGTFVSTGEAEIAKAKREVERMTRRVKYNYDEIQDIETEIKTLSSELSIEVGHFKSGYRQRKNAFEVQNRKHTNRTFEEILHEDFLEDKITPAARRMMLKAAAQQMKLKRGKEMIVNARRRTKKLEEFFESLLEATKAKDAGAIADAIVESERRTLSVINQQQDLDMELQKAAKALHGARKMQADEVAVGSSAKMLARKRQVKAKQIQLSRLDRSTSKHTVGLERDLKVMAGMSKHIIDMLPQVWPANDTRHYTFQQELQGHGGAMSVDMIQSTLGEIEQWIMTMKRVIKKNAGANGGAKRGRGGRRGSTAALSGFNGSGAGAGRSARGGILTDEAANNGNGVSGGGDGMDGKGSRRGSLPSSGVGVGGAGGGVGSNSGGGGGGGGGGGAVAYGPGGIPRRSDRRIRTVLKKFTVPVAPSIDRFAGSNDERPKHMKELKSQVEGIVSEAGGVEGMNASAALKELAAGAEGDGGGRNTNWRPRAGIQRRATVRMGVPGRRSSMAAPASSMSTAPGRRSSMKGGGTSTKNKGWARRSSMTASDTRHAAR
jgi:hypothetical protein